MIRQRLTTRFFSTITSMVHRYSHLAASLMVATLLLNACANQDGHSANQGERIMLPASTQVLGYLKKGENFFIRLILDGNRDTATLFTDLSVDGNEISGNLRLQVHQGNHSFQLEYFVILDDAEIIIATSKLKEYSINPGSTNVINFIDDSDALNRGLDYDSHDEDQDGRSNIDEINNHWNPKKANPPQPQNVHVTPQDRNILLTWDAVDNALDYTVYMASEPNVTVANYNIKARGMTHPGRTELSFQHPDALENDVTYYFVVTARNEFGESLESAEVATTPQPIGSTVPAAPADVTGRPLDGNVELTWTAVTGATSYVVYMASTTGVTKTTYAELNGMAHTLTAPPWNHPAPGLANGTTWYFVVAAVNAAGESGASNEVRIDVHPPAAAPSAPRNLSLSTGDGQAMVSWSPPPEPLASYAVYYRNQPGVTKANSTRITVGNASVTSLLLPPLTNGKTYYVAASASNSDGAESGLSTEVMGTPLAPWQEKNIDAALIGSKSESGSSFTIIGGGTDIWDNTDEFFYVYQSLPNNRMITAKITSQTVSHPWAKAGLMIRQSLTGNSKYAMVLQTAQNGIGLDYRAEPGAVSQHVTGEPGTLPRWLRLIRYGNNIEAQKSDNGTTWRLFGVISYPVFSDPLLVGMAVTSHDATQTSTAAFENVTITDASDLNIQLPQNPTDMTNKLPLSQNSGLANRFYVVHNLTANTKYSVEARNPSEDVDIMAYDKTTGDLICGSFIDGTVSDSCVATADAGGDIYLRTNGSNAATAGGNYTLNVVPYNPSVVALGTTVSHQIDHTFKYYEVRGVTPGTLYTINISNLSDDVDLYIYADEFKSMQYYQVKTGTTVEKSGLIARSNTLYFRIDGSNIGGATATYDLLVQP